MISIKSLTDVELERYHTLKSENPKVHHRTLLNMIIQSRPKNKTVESPALPTTLYESIVRALYPTDLRGYSVNQVNRAIGQCNWSQLQILLHLLKSDPRYQMRKVEIVNQSRIRKSGITYFGQVVPVKVYPMPNYHRWTIENTENDRIIFITLYIADGTFTIE